MKRREILVTTKGYGKVPTYTTTQAAGCDIYAANAHDIVVPAHGKAVIPTGLFFELPDDCEAQIRPRSGMAFKHDIEAYWGTIDADYIGEVGVQLRNFSDTPFVVKRGNRIAQAVFYGGNGLFQGVFKLVPEITKITERGANGFGHTGL